MLCLLLGVGAFALFLLYDWNSVRLRSPLLHGSFFLGCGLLAAATLLEVLPALSRHPVRLPRLALLGAALGFFLLLVYTLFFALPFQKTYVETGSRPTVCARGMYALCRHPGVLWFFFFYLCLGLALHPSPLLWQGLAFSLCNLLYVLVQDRWTFPQLLSGYGDYRRQTPFLLPSRRSLRAALSREK